MRNRQLGGAKFRRQFSVGKYILDFYCPEYRLGIEVDGGQHYEDNGLYKDAQRTKELENAEIEIIRFSNLEVLCNIEGVLEEILKMISPSP